MMQKTSNRSDIFALINGGIIAVVVIFFWLRELDLTFLATYRVLVLPVVIAGGVLIGLGSGRIVGRSIAENATARKKLAYALMVPLRTVAWFMLVVAIGMLVTRVPSAVWSFWRATGQSPLDLHAITKDLARLLLWTYSGVYLATPYLVLLRTPPAEATPSIIHGEEVA